VTLHEGDCLEVMAALPDASVDAVVTDPPYGLEFMGKEWDSFKGESWRAGAGMSQPGIGSRPTPWVSFGGTESANPTCAACSGRKRGARKCACPEPDWRVKGRPLSERNAGLEQMRAFQAWCKAIDKAAGAQREVVGPRVRVDGKAPGVVGGGKHGTFGDYGDLPTTVTAPATEDAARWEGWGTALKPAHEPIVLARKPLAGTVAGNILAHGTGALNIDGCRVEPTGESRPRVGEPSQETRYTEAGGTDFAVLPGVRGGNPDGRWPPNVLLGPEAAEELDRQSGISTSSGGVNGGKLGARVYGKFANETIGANAGGLGDSGGASRFFPVFRYQAKAPGRERPRLEDGTAWPTVKPLDLMRWLVRLVTPPGGTVLDPFSGTGTTGEACAIEGFRCILIERDPTAIALTRQRLSRPAQGTLGIGEVPDALV
jgi:site-specific DNA-methyltransferase (adenine-specific)